MTSRNRTFSRVWLAGAAFAAAALLLSACEYRPLADEHTVTIEPGDEPGHVEESHAPTEPGKTKGPKASPTAKGSQHAVACPTDEGLTNCGLPPTNAPPKAFGSWRVRTLAGSGKATYADGSAAQASFVNPIGVAVLRDGSVVVADTGAHRIRKAARNGAVTTLAGDDEAGHVNGPTAAARFRGPRGVAVGADGTIFVADTQNHVIRAIFPDGTVGTIAGTPGKAGLVNAPSERARFNAPVGIAVGSKNTLYVTELENHTVRVVSQDGSVVRTLAGTGKRGAKNGPSAQAQFDSPAGVAVDAQGTVYVADTANNLIRKIAGGSVATLAGQAGEGFKDGTGAAARFNLPYGIALASGVLYVTEFANSAIRRVDAKGVVRTIVLPAQERPSSSGSPSPAPETALKTPSGIAHAAGRLYVSDSGNGKIRVVEERK